MKLSFQIGLKRAYPASMEESKKKHSGTKVSKIANIFQGMPSREDDDMRGSDVTVVRTESHLARFNNARALFEKLGEENRGFRIEKSPSAASSFAGTRGGPPVAPSRSRSSSAGSVSPPRRIVTPTPTGATAVNGDRLANGASQPPPKPAKPSVLPKPEKPDRKFNKELIEKQRNWTAHFNKSKQNRNEIETKLDYKYTSGIQERKSPEASERCAIPSRVYSPPLSPCAGNSQLERPTTLPSSLINRAVPVTKSPSPVKNIIASPSPRSNNILVSPVLRTDNIISPPVRSDNIFHKHKTDINAQQMDLTENIYPKRNSSVSPQREAGFVASSGAERLQSPKAVDRTSPVLDAVVATQSNQKSPSPSARTLKNPVCSHEQINVNTSEPDRSLSPLSDRAIQPPEYPLDVVPPDSSYDPCTKSNDSSPQLPHDKLEENNSLPVKKGIETDLTASQLSLDSEYRLEKDLCSEQYEDDDDDEKAKRRSSTPESPACEKKEDVLNFPVASPLASPVHHNLNLSPPSSLHPSGEFLMYLCYDDVRIMFILNEIANLIIFRFFLDTKTFVLS